MASAPTGKALTLGGVAVAELARRYGTPLYVYDEDRIRENARRLFGAFRSRYKNFDLFYAIKANSNVALAAILVAEGLGIDAAATVEIDFAKRLGLSGDRILFSGNYLSDDDLKASLASGAIINLDDSTLFPRLLSFGVPELICFRINPGVGKSNVGERVALAGEKAKFGIPFEQASDVYRRARDAGVKRFGIHMMTGSCVTDPDYFREITTRLMDIVGKTAKTLGITFEFVDLGGGLGIPYRPDETPLDVEKTATLVVAAVNAKCAEYHLPPPRLLMEPARYFVGDAGYVIGRVHAVKDSYRRFVGTDIGFNTLMRPILYDAYHHIRVDGKEGLPLAPTNLTGQLCENTDVWCQDRPLPPLAVGDLIIVENAGAYGFSMSYPYNGRLRAAEVLVKAGQHWLIRERETVDDLCRGIVIPKHLQWT